MNDAEIQETPPFVLVIDDDGDIRHGIEALLAAKGCRVSTAGTGAEAVTRALSERPDVVLLDVMLPDMDGFEVCRRIKNEPAFRHIPILMLTALNDVMSKVKGLDAGADDFISKPFNEAELRARVGAFFRTKRLHDRLEASYRRLRELEDLRDSLTHMIMHDLVSPLTAIQIGVEAVIDRASKRELLGDVHERMLRTAHDGCRRLMDMLRDVLTVSRLEENKMPLSAERTSLSGLVRDALAVLEPTRVLSGVSIEANLPAHLPVVTLDPSLIGRVMVNLVANSLKFTPVGGTVSVSAQAAGDQVEVRVEDTGLGIAASDLEQIFSKFYQGGGDHAARKGQGLGLAFCRLAVEAHGGTIWAERREEQGSRFVFRLPIGGKAV